MKHTPEYLALVKIRDLKESDCARYVAKADSIAVDACIAYEHRQDDLLGMLKSINWHIAHCSPRSYCERLTDELIAKYEGASHGR